MDAFDLRLKSMTDVAPARLVLNSVNTRSRNTKRTVKAITIPKFYYDTDVSRVKNGQTERNTVTYPPQVTVQIPVREENEAIPVDVWVSCLRAERRACFVAVRERVVQWATWNERPAIPVDGMELVHDERFERVLDWLAHTFSSRAYGEK